VAEVTPWPLEVIQPPHGPNNFFIFYFFVYLFFKDLALGSGRTTPKGHEATPNQQSGVAEATPNPKPAILYIFINIYFMFLI
jgi:hypothetical protein